jgi:hypothetical protein
MKSIIDAIGLVLKAIFTKALSDKDAIGKKIAKCGEIVFMVLSGVFVEKNSTVDLLLVGDVDKQKLEQVLNAEIETETEKPVRYSILTREDFLYRLKCKDRFITEILHDPENIIAVNQLDIAKEVVL